MAEDDIFEKKRKHLQSLSDEELAERFWELTAKIVDPILELARTHTTESIERSVLLRMGFDSLQAKAIVDRIKSIGLLGKGAGHVVLKFSQKKEIPLKDAGLFIADQEQSIAELQGLFEAGECSET